MMSASPFDRGVVAAAALLATALLGPGRSMADCNQTSAGVADTFYFATMACPDAYQPFHLSEYDVRESEWSTRGYYDPCNVVFELTKHRLATALVDYDVIEVYSDSWHSRRDYYSAIRRNGGEYHNSLRHDATDTPGIYGRYISNFWGNNRIETACAVYNSQGTAHRAGTMIHESWHGWQDRHGYNHSPGHIVNPPGGTCTIRDANCDAFYHHGVGDFEFGYMAAYTRDGRYYHSPNQIEYEFLCDVAEHSSPRVNMFIVNEAMGRANRLAIERFVNGPAYRCGDPRPW